MRASASKGYRKVPKFPEDQLLEQVEWATLGFYNEVQVATLERTGVV